MSEELKICKDCKHYHGRGDCGRYAKLTTNPVTGYTSMQGYVDASYMRVSIAFHPFFHPFKNCGQKGRHWEAKDDE